MTRNDRASGAVNDVAMRRAQQEICRRFGSMFVASPEGSRADVAENVGTGLQPLNGLRHPVDGNRTGWFIWAGKDLSRDPDFFKSIHVSHLADRSPVLLPYLGLAPGWRFLVAVGYEDVWYDGTLLNI